MAFVDDLSAWVARQRWYAGKGHEPRLRILDAQPAPGATRYLLMDDAGNLPTLYQMPVALSDETVAADATVAEDAAGHLIDATRSPAFVTGLLAEMGVDTSRITGSRVFAGEQSNTSIVFDEDGEPTIILKLFRTLHHGENPDVTVQRALSDAGSPFVPRFYGSLEGEWPDAGRPSRVARGTLGFAQEFLPGARDGWSIAVEAARDQRDFTDAARDLGTAVAGVHAALAAALTSRPGRRSDADAAVAAWRRRLAIAAAEATITRLLTIQAEVDQAGGTDTAAYDAVATGKALQLYVANSTRIAEGPLLNEDGESIDGQSTVEGAITFEPLSAYGQEWQDVPNGLVIVPGCLDTTDLQITTADGKPAMKNPNPRNQVEYHVGYDVDRKTWLVNDRIDLGETC